MCFEVYAPLFVKKKNCYFVIKYNNTKMKRKKLFLLSLVLLVFCASTFSQGVAINETGSAPDASSMLDVSTTNKGLLIPRLTTIQRDAITSPSQSLIIYNITNKCLEIWENSQWNSIWCASCPVPSAVTASASPNPICSGSTLSLTGSATGATSWSWTGPNGFTSTAQSPSIAGITAGGSGVYSLTASNSCGSATAVNTASISVVTSPSQPTAISGLSTVASGSTGATYSISPVSGSTSYTWSVPCGATITSGQGTTSITVSFASVPSNLTYTTSGIYSVDCIKSATIEVIGAGGNGGGNGGGGGGGGGYAKATYSGLTGTSLNVTVGAGGSGIATSVGSLISATAGVNGTYVSNPNVGGGGAGGIGNTGAGSSPITHTGGLGGGGYWTYFGGGGAGAAGPISNGGNGGNTTTYPPCDELGGIAGVSGGAPSGAGGKGAGFNAGICNSTSVNPSAPGNNYGGAGGGGNGDGGPASNGAGGYCSLTSITYGGNITVTANNSCGSSSAQSLSVTVNP